MKIKVNLILTIGLLLMAVLPASAQSGMEEFFYQSGKIKVVVGVATIVMAGLLIYMWRLDNRVSKMEQQRKGGKS
jgi:CcmD family protein